MLDQVVSLELVEVDGGLQASLLLVSIGLVLHRCCS